MTSAQTRGDFMEPFADARQAGIAFEAVAEEVFAY